METPAQTCARLLAALEDLADQEAATLEARDFAAVAAIQDRAAPLVSLLAAQANGMRDVALRARIDRLRQRRAQTGAWLHTEMARLREELQQTQVAQRTVAQVAPAYGSRAHATRQLSMVG